jgi:hypothetical protein
MNTPMGSRPLGHRLATGFRRLLTFLAVVALLGLVSFLASERNARTYSVEVRSDQLVVLKGRMLPVGTARWAPSDPALAETYAPIPLEGYRVESSLLAKRFDDRDELDRALFGVLEQLARPRLDSDEPKTLERGFAYLRRAKRLPGITQEQRTSLGRMESELSWYQARLKLEQARQLLSEALSQLEIAGTGRNRNSEKANQLAARIAAPTRQYEDVLRRSLAGVPLSGEVQPEVEPTQGSGAAPAPGAPAVGNGG